MKRSYYLVVIRHKKPTKVKIRFCGEVDDHRVLESIIRRLKTRRFEVYLVHTKPEGPKKDIPKSQKKLFWCPYCRDWRKFNREFCGVKVCEICGISTKDFYFRKFNNF